VKQESCDTSSTSCIGASSAHLQNHRVEGGFGIVEIDKPDDGIDASSATLATSFSTQKELAQESQVLPTTLYEADYITTNGSEKQK
jgi:hypothetical protein